MTKYGFPMIIPAGIWHMRDLVSRMIGKIKYRLICLLWGIRGGSGGTFCGPTIVRTLRKGQIELGDEDVFVSRVSQNVVGLTQPTILDTRFGGRIKIGSRCGFSSVVMSSKSEIQIGDRVNGGGNLRIFDHDFHSVDSYKRNTAEDAQDIRTTPVCIEDDVWLGVNTIILRGTRIGARSIVSAGSVVFGLDIPPDSLVKGNPAEVVKRLKRQ